MLPFVVVVGGFLAGAALMGLGTFAVYEIAKSNRGSRAAAAPSEVPGRYAFAANRPSGIFLLDTATSRLRTCETTTDGTPPTCGNWSAN